MRHPFIVRILKGYFMKSVFILSLLLTVSTFASENVKWPRRLKCTGVVCLPGSLENFCKPGARPTIYFPKPEMIKNPVGQEAYDHHNDRKLNGLVSLDFSDGDQYAFYTFKAADVAALSGKRVNVIQGVFEDGYDWTNGYNTRARMTVSCTR